jgi:hypothetical protein
MDVDFHPKHLLFAFFFGKKTKQPTKGTSQPVPRNRETHKK